MVDRPDEDRRVAPVATTLIVVAILSSSALSTLWAATSQASGTPRLLATIALLFGALMTCASVSARTFSLAVSTYWVWSFVFLGLAPAYQMASGRFPWLGRYEPQTLTRAFTVILVAHVVVVLAVRAVGRWRQRRAFRDDLQVGAPSTGAGVRRRVLALVLIQVVVTALFLGLMGLTALVSGRAAFQARLLAVAELPGGATLYFATAATAITVPALAVLARRSGVNISLGPLVVSLALAALAMNPLIGTRFLTGSFAVAVVGAALLGRPAARWVPVGAVAALVTVFPSLDLLRTGIGSGERLQAMLPSETLVHFDFDAFEMFARAIVVHSSEGNAIDPAMVVLAPILRWVPFAGDSVSGMSSGTLVARASGMGFTNVSMPLWGEGYLFAGLAGAVLFIGCLAVWLGFAAPGDGHGEGMRGRLAVADAPTAALLFIVLRGSLYEVLGFLIFAAMVRWFVQRAGPRPNAGAARAPNRARTVVRVTGE